MKTELFVSFPLLVSLSIGWASAQTPLPSPTPTPKPHVVDVPQPGQPPASAANSTETLDPAKIADFEKRFAQGQELEQEGKLTEAQAIFDGILAEDPSAKGSLREAGLISVRLNDLPKANDYFEKLHALVPDYPMAIESLIQINQTLKRDVKVELLLREFRDLYASGKVSKPYFVRERIHLDQQEIIISQFFDYTKDPNTVWMAEVFDANGQLKRRLLLNYDPEATQALRAKDSKYANTQVFTWFEHVIKDQRVREIDAYLQIFALPDYNKFRSAMQVILANTPKPIYTQTVDAPVQ